MKLQTKQDCFESVHLHCRQSPLHIISYLQTASRSQVPLFSVAPVQEGRKPSTRCLCCQVKNWLKQAQPCNVQTPHLHFWLCFGQSVCSSAPKQPHLGKSSILQFLAISALKTSAHLVFWAQVCSNSHVLCMLR